MIDIRELAEKIKGEGYSEANAEAKLCQDIILELISRSSMSRHITVKGGVVMRSISGNTRRATQDMDIDFIRYSLSEESIYSFINKLNGLEGISVEIKGNIEELKHQDYHGKRVYVNISDNFGNLLSSKLDIGVHKHLSIKQDEYCFELGFQEEGASLLINSKEQMLTEKLRSILKFGGLSTRFKDIYDIYYLSGKVDKARLQSCFEVYIYNDDKMRENNIDDIIRRMNATFSNKIYIKNLSTSRKNWLDVSNETVTQGVVHFLEKLR